jgi:hypothetical protein
MRHRKRILVVTLSAQTNDDEGRSDKKKELAVRLEGKRLAFPAFSQHEETREVYEVSLTLPITLSVAKFYKKKSSLSSTWRFFLKIFARTRVRFRMQRGARTRMAHMRIEYSARLRQKSRCRFQDSPRKIGETCRRQRFSVTFCPTVSAACSRRPTYFSPISAATLYPT